MGCGCGKGKRGVGRRPIAGPAKRGGLSNGSSPAQIRQQALQNNVSSQSLSVSGLSKKRREVERKRRQAVLKALGRP